MLALLTDRLGPFDSYRYDLLDTKWQRAFDTQSSPARRC